MAPLLLMGKGDAEAAIRAQIAQLGLGERVHLHEFEPNPYPFMRQAHALLLSSDQEGLPTVLIESLICGRPVVSVDCPSGPAEILTGDLQPFLVPMHDEQALAAAIAQVVAAPPRIELRHYQRFLADEVVPRFESL